LEQTQNALRQRPRRSPRTRLPRSRHRRGKIRAIFVHPDWARRGLGTLLLETCENAAKSAGFTKIRNGLTFTGVPLYKLRGYQVIEPIAVPLPNGESLPVIRMAKSANLTGPFGTLVR